MNETGLGKMGGYITGAVITAFVVSLLVFSHDQEELQNTLDVSAIFRSPILFGAIILSEEHKTEGHMQTFHSQTGDSKEGDSDSDSDDKDWIRTINQTYQQGQKLSWGEILEVLDEFEKKLSKLEGHCCLENSSGI